MVKLSHSETPSEVRKRTYFVIFILQASNCAIMTSVILEIKKPQIFYDGRSKVKMSRLKKFPICNSLGNYFSLNLNDFLLTATLSLRQNVAELTEKKGRHQPHLLVAFRGHLREQRGEEAKVLEQDSTDDAKVGGHHNRITLQITHTKKSYQICTNEYLVML